MDKNKKTETKQPKFEVTIREEICKGCQLCIVYCPTKHLGISQKVNKKGLPYAVTKIDTTCIGCGACYRMCPENCIVVYEKK